MKPRLIALYLPQFHPIPENDKWWGPGFTEWTNVVKAKPLFRGHQQPKIPADLGFYDLRLPETREHQALLAREAGIEGFCYYHYWFGNGKQLLERPFNEVVESGKPDFPFCLCWANHTWSNKTWERKSSLQKNSTLIEQTYPGVEDDINHFYSLLNAFKDKRYIKVDGKLLFVVYNPYDMPEPMRFIEIWRKLAQENGLPGFHFVGMTPSTLTFKIMQDGARQRVMPNLKSSEDIFLSVLNMGFDAVNSFGKRRGEMLYEGKWKNLAKTVLRHIGVPTGNIKYDYARTVRNFFAPEDTWDNVYPTILPQWDRTPRVSSYDGIYVNATPDKFEKHIYQALDMIKSKTEEHQILFLKSWNEWGEGNYVEPDVQYGHGFLDAIKKAIKSF
ncbi:glycoside hydrolase family 99-like domain-containing protein [Xylanibacter rarus]|uniref:glycosyltransferase WbsX family protein n=1 Tax=Xylanibacter rarus TaxID=1676614 RepID=UPI003AB94457